MGSEMCIRDRNHGMYDTENIVKISGVVGNVKPSKLSLALDVGNSSSFTVDDGSVYENFENVGVGTTNIGLVKIGDEVIQYNNVSGNVLTIANRGNNKINYAVGTPVNKYELSGVSLARINRTHGLSTSTASATSGSIGFDSYNIKLDMSGEDNIDGIAHNDTTDRSTDVGFPKLYLGQTQTAGGYQVHATQNMQFQIITPICHNMTVTGTSIGAEIRTTSATSLSGDEIPYIDQGFESVTIGESNYMTSPRAIYSKVNEDDRLDNFEGNKSMQMRLTLVTTDTRLSPVLDAQRVSTILTSNRVNDVISNYATDDRVKSMNNDPTGCQYITKEISLENAATSLKILLGGHIHSDADIRAFYAIGDRTGFEPIFTPFPGFENLNSRGQVINSANNNGQSDAFVPKTNQYGFGDSVQFSDYTFTADDLPAFRYYRIKLLLISSDQVYVPRVKDLRVMALA